MRAVPAARAATHHKNPPGLWLFLAALRWQESGSPAGNYKEPNGQGAYQIIQSNWPSWAKDCAGYITSDPNASHAPPRVQDAVARCKVTRYYYGPAGRSWRKVARLWNGGSVDPVPNNALCSGCTTDTYATQLLTKADALRAQGYKAPRHGAPTNFGPGAYKDTPGTPGSPGGPPAPGCQHPLKISIPAASDIHLCMDKPIAVVLGGAGLILLGGGVAIVVISMLGSTNAGKAIVQTAGLAGGPAGKAAAAVASAAPAARTERRQERESAEARRTAPARAAARIEARAASVNEAREMRARVALARAQPRPVTNYYMEPIPRRLIATAQPLPADGSPPF